MAEKEGKEKSGWQALKDLLHGKEIPDNLRIFLFSIVNFITGMFRSR